MRVVLDLQLFPACAARHKGVEHYGASLARALIRHAGKHDIHAVVSHACEDAIEDFQNNFPDLMRSVNFRIWQMPFSDTPGSSGHWHRSVGDLLRGRWLLQLKPDVILSSLLSGTADAGAMLRRGSSRDRPPRAAVPEDSEVRVGALVAVTPPPAWTGSWISRSKPSVSAAPGAGAGTVPRPVLPARACRADPG